MPPRFDTGSGGGGGGGGGGDSGAREGNSGPSEQQRRFFEEEDSPQPTGNTEASDQLTRGSRPQTNDRTASRTPDPRSGAPRESRKRGPRGSARGRGGQKEGQSSVVGSFRQMAEGVAEFGEEKVSAVTDRAETEFQERVEEFDRIEESDNPLAYRADQYIREAEANPDLVEDATTGGVLSEETEQGLRSSSDDYSRELTQFIEEGSSSPKDEGTAEDALEGVALGLGNAVNPFALVLGAETSIEAGEAIFSGQYGVTETAETATAVGREAGEQVAQDLRDNPAQGYGQLFGGAVAGVAAGRGIETLGRSARAFNVGRRADANVDFQDITSERGARGELPEFETGRNEPTGDAVDEIRARASDQPEEVQELAGSDSVLFRSESERLPEDVDVQRGQYELPGLFASPDASPLRLPGVGGSSLGLSSLRPRLPRLRGDSPRLSAFESPDIEGMPDWATGSGRVVDPETGDPIPDPRTSGAQFLDEQADAGTAFVRPQGGRTSELEAIFPPGSQFQRTSIGAVDFEGGDVGTLDIFRRVQGDADTDMPEGDLVDLENLPSSRGAPDSEGSPVIPLSPTSAGGPTGTSPFGGFGQNQTPASGGSVFESESTTTTGVFGGGADTVPPSTTDTDTEAESSAPTNPPSSPPSSPADVFTSTPPTTPPSGPPTSPGGSGPFTFPTSPPGGEGDTPGSTPPSRPPSSPPSGGPSGAPGGGSPFNPFIPEDSGSRPRWENTDSSDDEEDLPVFTQPFDTEFVNPVATGQTALFGNFAGLTGQQGVGTDVFGGDAGDGMSLFGGFGEADAE